jgi:hypothetical protein
VRRVLTSIFCESQPPPLKLEAVGWSSETVVLHLTITFDNYTGCLTKLCTDEKKGRFSVHQGSDGVALKRILVLMKCALETAEEMVGHQDSAYNDPGIGF